MSGLDEYGLPNLESLWIDELTGEKVTVKEVCVYTYEIDDFDGVEVEFSSDVFSGLGVSGMDLENFLSCYKWVSNEQQ